MKKAIRLTGLFSAIAALIVIAGALYFFVSNPFKITDPYHPWFRPDRFRFEDYLTTKCMQKEVLAKLFPVGTEKSFVDKVLVTSGKATMTRLPDAVGYGSNTYSYYWESSLFWGNWFFPSTLNVAVFYNQNGEVSDITLPIGGPPGESVYNFFDQCKFRKSYGGNWK